MTRRTRSVSALVCALLAVPALAAAQTPQDSVLGDTLIIDRPLAGTADSFRIALVSGGQYRVSLRPSGATLSAVSTDNRKASAFAARVRTGGDLSPDIIELYPTRTAEYLLVVSAGGGLNGGYIRLWSDRQLAQSKKAQRDRAWGIGLSFGGGWHSGYYTGADDAHGGKAGSSVEGCLLVGSSGPVSGCLGFTRQKLGSSENAVAWFFIEPRFRFLTFGGPRRPIDLLATARIGQGNSERLSVDPSMLAPGVLFAYDLDDQPGARGWKLNLQALYAFVGNVATTGNSDFFQVTLSLSWIP